MLVTGNKNYALFRAAQVIYAFDQMRGVKWSKFESVLQDLTQRVRELEHKDHGDFISSGCWTATRQLSQGAEEASVYISFNIAEIHLDPEWYHYVNNMNNIQESWEYFETPQIPIEEQV